MNVFAPVYRKSSRACPRHQRAKGSVACRDPRPALSIPVDRVLEQIKGTSWERFHKMNLQDSTQTLVQRDKREIANWKNRLRSELA